MQTILGPTPSLVTPERPAQFGRISVADYYDLCFSQGIRGKSYLNDIKITKAGEC
jgi:hypothetical protein